MDNKGDASYSAVYSVYDRKYGTREDFVVMRAEKDFRIERLGTFNVGVESQIPLASQFNQTTVAVSLKFTPGRRK